MSEVGRVEGVYEFGDFRLLAAQRRLTARSDGRPIELTPKALDTLLFLVQHPGELLDKSALIAAVIFHYAFVSVWCFFAAVLAAYLVVFFYRLPAASAAKDLEQRVSAPA